MKFAMLGLAAILLSTNAVAAAEITFDGRCDSMSVTHYKNFYGGSYTACHSKPLQNGWGGWKGWSHGIGENVALHFYDVSGQAPIPYVFDIQLPLATGNRWVLYKSPDGIVVKKVASGTYTVTSK